MEARHILRLRRLTGATLLALAVGWGLLSFWSRTFQVCAKEEVFNDQGQLNERSTSCRPVSFTDPLLVLLIAGGIVLLIPGITKMGFGGISFERPPRERVPPSDEMRRIDRGIDEKTKRLLLAPVPLKEVIVEEKPDAGRSRLESVLLRFASELEAWAGAPLPRRGTLTVFLDDPSDVHRNSTQSRRIVVHAQDSARVQLWRDLFKEEVLLVRAARNQLVHDPAVLSIEQLEEAVEIARKLLVLLHRVSQGAED